MGLKVEYGLCKEKLERLESEARSIHFDEGFQDS